MFTESELREHLDALLAELGRAAASEEANADEAADLANEGSEAVGPCDISIHLARAQAYRSIAERIRNIVD